MQLFADMSDVKGKIGLPIILCIHAGHSADVKHNKRRVIWRSLVVGFPEPG